MTERRPSVSVIIVNWNGERFIRDCFLSLEAQSFRDFEVVFVDNASSDGSLPTAKKVSSAIGLSVKFVGLPVNTGFTGGNIEGLKHSSGEYIALLNNDTVASEGWLGALVGAMEAHPEVGICASKLIVAGTDIIDSAGDVFTTALKACKRGEGLPSSHHTAQELVFGACAGAALYRRSMLDEIGFFDDDFFLIFEDADLNFRAQLSGWKCLFVPDALVQHRVGASIKRLGEAATTHALRNSRIVILKDIPASVILAHLPCFVADEIVVMLYHIRIGRFRSYLRGNYEFLKSLSYYMKKRSRVMRTKKVTSRYINSLLTSAAGMYYRKYSSRARTLIAGR